ncbi:RING-H2 finger protein ATL80 isoform X2 [Spinacia oleracea]|uniref:RING-H2 finger protein ATL80 isoform X2 n=1 Tax=Spinacia oleracea TaxID=3562 RepID=A0A9R0JUB6_SPIOL|nr:RING-H2 finger protein ATL80-like isoform X2 [Spinacia oleracea]
MAVGLRLLSQFHTDIPAANNAGLHSSPSDYVVILAALCCALICAVGLVMAARCVCLHRPLNLFMTAPVLHTSPPGLNKKTLQLLPTTKYLCEAGDSNKQADDCAICLTEFSDGDMMRILPRCGHAFHITCIDTWLGSHSSCPSCRQLVLVVGKCHHCGGFSAHQGFHGTANDVRTREIDVVCRQDYTLTQA